VHREASRIASLQQRTERLSSAYVDRHPEYADLVT